MFFPWSKKERRKRLLAEPFPEEWRRILRADLPVYETLTPEEREKLEADVRILLAEKTWEATKGFELTDEIRVVIAAQACLLILHRSVDDYERVHTILVHPKHYLTTDPRVDEAGIVSEGGLGLLGQSWGEGTVALSWADSREGGRNMEDGRNVVFHEFAHQLDTADHVVDGTPWLDGKEAYARWVEVMSAEFAALRESAEEGRRSVLDAYGATDEAEFFAVATEAFFERSVPLRTHHPGLYDVLKEYYRQDPASRKRPD